MFLSDDAGETWTQVNDRSPAAPARVLLLAHLRRPEGEGHALRAQRRLLPLDRRRQDATRRSSVPHGDNHDLWIAPDDPKRMIERQRRRRQRLVNAGENWTEQDYPTAQFYNVFTTESRAVSRVRRAAGQHARRACRAPAAATLYRRSAAARAATSRRIPRKLDVFYRRQLRRPADALQPADRRRRARDQRLAGQSDGPLRQGHDGALPVDVPDRVRADTIRTRSTSRRSTCSGSRPTKARAGSASAPT